MEQKFKVGDLVRLKDENKIGKIVDASNYGAEVDCGYGIFYYAVNKDLELAYPSDHDLLDFASRDSKIAELTAKVSELEAELEKYKPKPESVEVELVLVRCDNGCLDWYPIQSTSELDTIVARKTVTITEGEGM